MRCIGLDTDDRRPFPSARHKHVEASQVAGHGCPDRQDPPGQAGAVAGAGTARDRDHAGRRLHSVARPRPGGLHPPDERAGRGHRPRLKSKHLDPSQCRVIQDACEVATKFGRSFDTSSSQLATCAGSLRSGRSIWAANCCGGLTIPCSRQPRRRPGPIRLFHAVGLEPGGTGAAQGPIWEVFRRAFAAAGVPYFPPHRIRNTLVILGQKRCQTPEPFKVWSQNLSHNQVLTTFTNYEPVSAGR